MATISAAVSAMTMSARAAAASTSASCACAMGSCSCGSGVRRSRSHQARRTSETTSTRRPDAASAAAMARERVVLPVLSAPSSAMVSATPGRRPPRAAASLLRDDVDEDLVGLDHAQLHPRLLLDHLQAFLQVAHLGRELVVGMLGLHVGGLLLLQLALHLAHGRDAAAPEPQ